MKELAEDNEAIDASVIDWWNKDTFQCKTIAKGILEPWNEEDESGNVPFKIVTPSYNLEDGITMDGFFLMFKGYGDASSGVDYGSPILIEIDNGALRVVVWSDINTEDSTHSVSLCGALESNWKGDEYDKWSPADARKAMRDVAAAKGDSASSKEEEE